MEEGLESADIEIIPNPKEGIKHAWKVIKSARKEVLIIFSTANAFRRQPTNQPTNQPNKQTNKQTNKQNMTQVHHTHNNSSFVFVLIISWRHTVKKLI